MIDGLVGLCIRHRWLVMVATVACVALGVAAYQRLPIDAVPDITDVQVQINTAASGYTPLEVEQRVTIPIEAAMSGMKGLESKRSISAYGLSQVTVVFAEGTEIYFARQQVLAELAQIKGALPPGIEPEMGPVSTGLGEIYMYTVDAEPGARRPDGRAWTPADLRSVQDWQIRPRLLQVAGVSEVNSIGGYVRTYQVAPDAARLIAYRLSLHDLVDALEKNNANVGAGYIEHNGEQSLVRVPGQLGTLAEIANVVVAVRDDTPIKVADVADVSIGHDLRTGAATHDAREAVLGTALLLFGENSRSVSRAVGAKLAEIAKQLPPGVRVTPVYDRATLVDRTIATVKSNLFEGALLVVAVLFLFLGNLRAALITAAVIPLSLLAVFAGMVKAGVSGNLMSLGALDFGLIVDGTLIIVENCILRLAEAQRAGGRVLARAERLEVVRHATREVFRPALVSVAVIVLVNLPLFTLTGVEGKMFVPMAFAVVVALTGALACAVTFVPAAAALLLSGRIREEENRLVRGAKRLYAPLLRAALRRRGWVVLATVGFVVACGGLATRMGAEFIPSLDEGDIAVGTYRPPSTGIEQAVKMQLALNRVLLGFPEVKTVFARNGTAEVATDVMPPGQSDTIVMLKDRTDWPDPDQTKAALIEAMQRAVSTLPGEAHEFTQPIEMRFEELLTGVRGDLAIKVFGDDLEVLRREAEAIADVVRRVPGAADVVVEQAAGLSVLTILPERTRLARFGLAVGDLQDAVSAALGGRETGLIYDGDARYPLTLRLAEAERSDPGALARLPLTRPVASGHEHGLGSYVPLGEVARIEDIEGPNRISRDDGKRRVVVAVNVRGRALTDFVDAVQARIDAELKLPPGYYLGYGGTFQQLQSAGRRLTLLVPLSLLLVFGLLFMTFGAFKDALLVFSGVPLALTGGVLFLLARGLPLSITAGVGFITLSGVAVLTGVVMVSAIRDLRAQGVALDEAITRGALRRLRPILMIGLVAALGFLPMALNTHTGAEVQRPLATVVIGGIFSATLLSLFVLPALYRMAHGGEKAAPDAPGQV